MRRAMGNALLGMSILVLPAVLAAQTPQPAASPAPIPYYVVRYEPGHPVPMPIQTCEIQVIQSPRPYSVKLPVTVKIYLYDAERLTRGASIFEGTIKEPKKLDPGVYEIDVEGQKEPIYVVYGTEDAWQTYTVYKEPEHSLIGPFVIPGVGRLPIGEYSARGTGFELTFSCRNKERAAFNIPSYDTLPPFLAPAIGIAW